MRFKLPACLMPIFFVAVSCSLIGPGDEKLTGGPSMMAEEGAEISVFDSNGMQGASAFVTSSKDGIATFSGQAMVTNQAILNVISGIKEFTVNGNFVTITGWKFKITKDGIESKNSSYPGIIVKYDSNVGETYDAGSGVKRKVTGKSTADDYLWGGMKIKVIKVEESPSLIHGVKRIVYFANHRFGIVGFEITFDDNSVTKFDSIWNTENE